ncbi:MAG: hypothetical protein PHP42_02810 [Bacteroidota bacterium]|nr:hypothetical protein [Bacteroidota bacterium]
MKKIITLLLLFSVSAFAGKGSIYSRFGIGDINPLVSGRTVGMGNTGVALLGDGYINDLNPAALANISHTVITADYQFQNLTAADPGGTSILNNGNISGFSLAFPVYAPKKMVLSLAVLPYSSVGYEQQQSQNVGKDAVTITQMYEGRGGLTSGQLSLSYAPSPNFLVGVTTHYLFGAIYSDQTINFDSPDFFGGSYNQTMSMRGFGFTLGGIYSGIDKALGLSDGHHLNLGATFFTGSSLTVDDETLRNFSSNRDTVAAKNHSLALPFGFSTGLAYLRNNIVYAADVHFQSWDNYKIRGVHPAELQNSIRFGAGAEFLQAKEFTDSFWEKLAYRIGGYYDQTNLKINGQSINGIFGTAGIGFPFSGDSRLNIGIEYGIRGTRTASLIEENIFRMTFSLSASETMFIQPPVE